jgi:ParB-like chromosome segregation protein Spo0J
MNDMIDPILREADALFQSLDTLSLADRIAAINALRRQLHAHSPFAGHPADCVQWVPAEQVTGNGYNPNAVAPPELRLLEHSIRSDGFTQPIVVHGEGGRYVVVDGFHRKRMGKEVAAIREQLHGHLPVALVRAERGGMGERMAATIRHNRARGVHAVLPMTDIVAALIRQGWSDERVARELGMDEDEVRRFKQVSGLPELFRDHPYSKSWE